MDFDITWCITDDEWAKAAMETRMHAPGSSYDQASSVYYYLLYGDVQLSLDGCGLWHDPVNISLADVADQLARLFAATDLETARPGEVRTFQQADDMLEVHFVKREGFWSVTSNLDASNTLQVPDAALVQGVHRFLRSFVSAIERQVPAFLDWKSFRSLSPYRQKSKQV